MGSSGENVALVGLGSMGKTLGIAMLRASIKLSVWNRTAERPAVTELVNAGAKYEPNLATALSKCDTVIFCVVDYPAITSLLDQNTALNALSGKNVINLTNSTPDEARSMNEKMKSVGVSKYIDGGIMVPPPAIATPASFIFISGEDEPSANEFNDLIATMGTPHYFGEDPGAAALLDLALLAGMYGMFGGLFTAVSMMKRQKRRDSEGAVKVAGLVKQFLNPLLQMLLASQERTAAAIDAGDFAENHGHPMGMMSVSMDNILKACESEGVDSSAMRPFDHWMKRAIEKGGADCGLAQIANLMSK